MPQKREKTQMQNENERVIKEGWKKHLIAEWEGKQRKVVGLERVGVKNKDSMRCKRVWRWKRWCEKFSRIIVLSWQRCYWEYKRVKKRKDQKSTSGIYPTYHLE